jgi:hypothetical protein
MVETDRIVMKQISGTAMSIYTGFAKIQKKASLVIDGSITVLSVTDSRRTWCRRHHKG